MPNEEMKKASLLQLIHELKCCLQVMGDSALNQLVADLAISPSDIDCEIGNVPRHQALLHSAIVNIPDHKFGGLKTALLAAKGELCWRVDDGAYYSHDADVGEGYRNGNMHALLLGPENSIIQSDEILLGFFLLAPKTLYRDHKHSSPEIYVPLTGPSGWRFEGGEWLDHEPGDIIKNAPEIVHATRVYETPFLALFAWSRDINSICSVVPFEDWQQLETELQSSQD